MCYMCIYVCIYNKNIYVCLYTERENAHARAEVMDLK